MGDFFIGVTSSISTALLLWLFGVFVRDSVLPWYRKQKYEGVLIEGEWVGSYLNFEQPHECAISIKQVASTISGELIELVGPDKGKRYNLTGELRNLILTLTYSESNFSRIDRGVIALSIGKNGNLLTGHTVYYSDEGNELLTKEYQWTRQI